MTCSRASAVHVTFGIKVAILAVDYHLARASIFLSRLRDVEVVNIMSGVIEHLVSGEVMQIRGIGVSSSGARGNILRYQRVQDGAVVAAPSQRRRW